MKQFLTLCLATAMLGVSVNVDAKMTVKRAMELKSEGKAFSVKTPLRTRAGLSMKQIQQVPSSRFNKVMLQKTAAKEAMMKASANAPAKVTAQGDNIFGYLGYNEAEMPMGLYEFNDGSQVNVWEDALYEAEMISPSCLSLQDGVLKGYIADIFLGMLFGVYYVEYDFASGEVLRCDSSEESAAALNFIQNAVLDPETETFYGYGCIEGTYCYMSAPADDPFNFEKIADIQDNEMCMSICYNATEDAIVGVNLNYELVQVDKASGTQVVLANLDVANGATYMTGLVYDAISNRYYWNINTQDDMSYMATIDGSSYDLDIYEELKASEEYMSLFTTDVKVNPDKPKRPIAGKADFYKDNLIGFVSFTLPSEMADGAAIEGDVEYKTYLDGEIYSTGKAAAGSEVEVNFAVAEDGTHVFGLRAFVNGEQSPMASVKYYVGNDVPLAPAYVELTEDEISWAPVVSPEGVHGGYVDVKAIEYDVYLNDEFVARTDGTSQVVNIDKEAEMSSYFASVVAVCNGYESTPAYSKSIVAGAAFELPVYIEPTPDEFAISTVLDGNEDGATWRLDESEELGYYIDSNWSRSNDMDEWYFLPPVKIDDVSKFYSFAMEACIRSAQYPNEYVEVLVCNEPNKQGVVGEVIPEFMPSSDGFQTVSGEFRVRQAGDYYIALHCTSEADQYGVWARNFSIEDNNITLGSPEAVESIDLEAASEGKLEATATFTLPTVTLGGVALDAGTELEAKISCGENTASVSGKPGDEVSAVIKTAQGYNSVAVVVSLGDLNSPVMHETVYTGVVAPVSVDGLTYEVSEDNCTITLTWDPVTEGVDGGFINPDDVVYDIYKPVQTIFGAQWALFEPDVTATTYAYTADIQELLQLGVVARNEAGDNGMLSYVTAVVGPSYELPIEEDFDDPDVAFYTEPWVTYSFNGVEKPQLVFMKTSEISEDYADAETTVLAALGAEGAMGQLGTPKFTTVGVESAFITLDICGDVFLPKLTLLADAEDVEAEVIGEITQDEEGFHKVTVEIPAKFLNKKVVGLYLQYEFETGEEALFIESIVIGASSGVVSVASDDVKIATGKNIIKVTGLNGQNVTVSTLDGRVAAKAAKVSREASFEVENGIYIVNAADKKVKVVVK